MVKIKTNKYGQCVENGVKCEAIPVAGIPEPDLTASINWWNALGRTALCVSIVLSLLLHFLHAISRPPDFDEHIHLHYLWMTAQGLLPDRDFLSPYPSAPFLVFAPLFSHLPERPMVFLVLRFLSLVPLALCMGAVAFTALNLKRDPWLALGLVMLFNGSGEIPAGMEVRFDIVAWSAALGAFALLIAAPGRLGAGLAAALAVFSLFVSPKHLVFLGGFSLGYGVDLMLRDRRALARQAVAALVGAGFVLAWLTYLQPSTIPDSIRLSLMNLRSQQGAVFPESLLVSLLFLGLRDPVVTSVLWVAPVLFLRYAAHYPLRIRFLYGGALVGGLVTILMMPCGWSQYISLALVLFWLFIPWMTPSLHSRWLSHALSFALAAGSLFYAVRDVPSWSAQRLMEQIRMQNELARLCPPGEYDLAAPISHTWFRLTPGYVFIDEKPSFRAFLPPGREHYFTTDYLYQRLVETKPAILSISGMSSAPPEYLTATVKYLEDYGTNYVVMEMPCLFQPGFDTGKLLFYCRRDRVSKALISQPYTE